MTGNKLRLRLSQQDRRVLAALGKSSSVLQYWLVQIAGAESSDAGERILHSLRRRQLVTMSAEDGVKFWSLTSNGRAALQ